MASSASTQPADGREGRPLGVTANALRNTWKAMNDWGDEFERKHFDGDLVGALAAAPRKVGEATKNTIEAVKEWKDEIEREFEQSRRYEVVARWRYSPPDGFPIDIRAGPEINGQRTANQLQAGELVDVSEERAVDGVVFVRLSDGRGWLFDQKPGVGVLCVREEVVERPPPEPRGSDPVTPVVSEPADEEEFRQPPPALWSEVQRLQQGLNEERERRRGRVAALRVLDEAVRPLRAELAQEPTLQSSADSERSVVEHRLHAVERAFEELQERHHHLLSRRASQEAEAQRHSVEAKRADSAARLRAGGQVDWARHGPEMEALKVAKMELAELLGRVDEDRLQKRRELRDLVAQVEAAENEREQLRRTDVYVAPKGSFLTSMRRLWTVANGREDPYQNLETQVT